MLIIGLTRFCVKEINMKHNRKVHGGLPPERTLTQPMSQENYKPEWVPVRPGSQDHENVPSRRASTREWRDGRVEAA
jgi:hypothetical protein